MVQRRPDFGGMVTARRNWRAVSQPDAIDISCREITMNVAMLLSCGSFEGFFGWVQGQSRQSYLESYRSDWSWYYARGLLENDVKPTLYIPALRESGRYQTDVGVTVRFLPLERWYGPMEQVWLKRLLRQTRWTLYAVERINTIAFMKSLRDAIEQDDIDILYIQEYWSGRFDHIVNAVDIPVTAADHGGVSTSVVKLFKPRAFEKAALCYGQTESECRMIEQYGGRSKFLPNGCDISEFSPDPTVQRSRTVLTVTRLTNKQKRTSDLIRAVAQLPEEWSLDIVGTGPDRRMMEKLAADLNIEARVRFHGFVGRAEVREFLRRCGVYAMPSANEAVALAALEAMACGASVVLSRIRAFEQLITDGVNGHLVPVGDVKRLAAGILSAWERRGMFGPAAAETVKARYNTRVLYSDLAESLRGLLRSKYESVQREGRAT
jgi:glycosyltransferase involved in cell wall biosynthesis